MKKKKKKKHKEKKKKKKKEEVLWTVLVVMLNERSTGRCIPGYLCTCVNVHTCYLLTNSQQYGYTRYTHECGVVVLYMYMYCNLGVI